MGGAGEEEREPGRERERKEKGALILPFSLTVPWHLPWYLDIMLLTSIHPLFHLFPPPPHLSIHHHLPTHLAKRSLERRLLLSSAPCLTPSSPSLVMASFLWGGRGAGGEKNRKRSKKRGREVKGKKMKELVILKDFLGDGRRKQEVNEEKRSKKRGIEVEKRRGGRCCTLTRRWISERSVVAWCSASSLASACASSSIPPTSSTGLASSFLFSSSASVPGGTETRPWR